MNTLWGRMGLASALALGFLLLSVKAMEPALYIFLIVLGAAGLVLFVLNPKDGDDS